MIKLLISIVAIRKNVCALLLTFPVWIQCASASYQLLGSWRFNEGSGIVALDESGMGHDGMLTNMDTNVWTEGISGHGLYFDGVGGWVNCGSDASLNPSDAMTIAAWINMDSSSGHDNTIVNRGYATDAGEVYWLEIRNYYRTVRFYWGDGTAKDVLETSNAVSPGQWRHIAATFDSGAAKIYIDGELAASKTSAITNIQQQAWDTQVGRYWTGAQGHLFAGILDEVRIYGDALDAVNIRSIFRGGIRGCWQMNNDGGDVANDDSGFNNHGILTNMGANAWTGGVSGCGLHFDGVDDWVNCGSDASLNPSDAMTIAAWINMDSSSGHDNTIVNRGYATDAGEVYWLEIRNYYRTVRFYWGDGTAKDVLETSNAVSPGQWRHIAATFDSGAAKIYIDGELAASKTSAITNIQQQAWDTQVGRYWTGAPGHLFAGSMDEVRIFSKALNPNEIAMISSGFRAKWEMNEGTGSLAADDSGYNNHGSLINMDSSAWVDGILDSDGYFRHALHFDGFNDFIDCGCNVSLNLTAGFTLSMWLKLTGNFSGKNGLFNSGPDQNLSFYLDSGNHPLKVRWRNHDGFYAEYTLVDSVPEDQWTLITIVYDNNTDLLSGYKSGNVNVVNTNVGGIYADATTCKYIGWADGDNGYFHGDIDKVYLNDCALSEQEIQTMAIRLYAQPDRNYYTGEDAIAICGLNLASGAGLSGNCYIVAKSPQGAILGSNDVFGLTTDLIFSTCTLPLGTNVIAVEMRKYSGELICDTNMDVLVCAPRIGGGEIKIDMRKGIILRDGVGFFPYGIYTPLLGNRIKYRGQQDGEEGMFDYLSQAGFNTLIRLPGYEDADMFMALANQYGMSVINWNTSISPPALDTNIYPTLEERLNIHQIWYANMLPSLTNEIAIISAHTNLLAYYSVDEPNLSNSDERIAVAEWYWRTVKSMDQYRPLFLLFNQEGIPDGENWTRWGDLLGQDIYPWPFMPGMQGDPGLLTAYHAYRLRERCLADGKVMIYAPLASILDPGRTPVGMSPSHMLCQAYAAIIYGAKGLLYFSLPNVMGINAWEALHTIGCQVTQMAPALLNGYVSHIIQYMPDNFNPAAGQFPMVNAALFKYPGGNHLLLAANIKPYAVDTTFTIDGLLSAERLFSSPGAISLDGESFTNRIEGYGVRAYEIALATNSLPVGVVVDMTAHEDDPAPQVNITNIVAQMMSGKNYCPNPCFIRQYNPGIPDFWRPYFQLEYDPNIGQTGSTWHVDSDQSLRMYRCSLTNASCTETRGVFGSVYPAVSGEMTFSFYAKSGRIGDRLWVRIIVSDVAPFYETDIFNLTTDWERYQMVFYMQKGSSLLGRRELFIQLLDEETTAWISGLQMELGDVATIFQDDSVPP